MKPVGVDPDQHACDASAWRLLDSRSVRSSLGERFRLQASLHGPCLAVRDESERITYAELERRSLAVAEELHRVGATPGSRVVLLFVQGATSIASTLGTLLAGSVYVPLDRDEPDVRLRDLLERIGPTVVLTDDESAARVSELAPGLPIVKATRAVGRDSGTLPSVAPGAPAAIHFTSGSTGAPKGVVDCHRNIVHNALRYTVGLAIEPTDRLSLIQPPASSATMSSIFAALLNGAALFPYRLDTARLATLASWLRSEHITIYHSVPSILRRALAFAGELPDLRVVRLEGDRAYAGDMAVWRRHLRSGTTIANGLGITEAGLCRQLVVAVGDDLGDGIMPVGFPVADVDVEVVGDDGRPLETGAAGEIIVTSEYLATGYWDDARLTASVFTPAAGRPGARTYRTGDLGLLHKDGCLEYLGRRDGLAKVLGHRVEPAEVEAALAAVPGVDAIAVRIADDDRGEGRIIAYVAAAAPLEERSLRAAAEARLPAYMRPHHFVVMRELPASPNGKVDRAALPDLTTTTQPPHDSTDTFAGRVASIMEDVLGRPIGPDDDFFLAGGDSMGAVDVLLGLERLTGRRLPPSLLVQAPTVAQLADFLEADPPDRGPRLYGLTDSGPGLPLVLVPSHYGHALAYVSLAHHLAAVRPVFTSDVSVTDDATTAGRTFESIARQHLSAVAAARLDGPFLLGGFCFGGAMAYEMARQLSVEGMMPAGLFLLGVSPYDFPGLVPSGAKARWDRSMTPWGKLGRIARVAAGMTTSEGGRYASHELVRRGRTLARVNSRAGRERRRSRSRRNARMRTDVGHYHGPALAVPVTVILPSWSLSSYWDDPRGLWAGIGSDVDVRVVPGVERMMLGHPVVSTVAEIMTADPGSAALEPEET